MSTTLTFIQDVLGQATAARDQGASKIVLNADAVVNAFTECEQIASAGAILQRLEALSLDDDDLNTILSMVTLTEDLSENAEEVSAADERLFDSYRNLVDRLSTSNLFAEVDDDDDEYSEYDDDDYDDDVVSSFRRPYPQPAVLDTTVAPPAPRQSFGTWLSNVLNR